MRNTLWMRLLRVLNTQGGLNINEAAVQLGEEWWAVRRETYALLRGGLVQRDSSLRYRPTILGLDRLRQDRSQLSLLEVAHV